jgi:hypothetical protein
MPAKFQEFLPYFRKSAKPNMYSLAPNCCMCYTPKRRKFQEPPPLESLKLALLGKITSGVSCATPAHSPGMVQALHHLAKGAFTQVPHDLIYKREEAGREHLKGRRLAAPVSSQHSNSQKQKKVSLSLLHS